MKPNVCLLILLIAVATSGCSTHREVAAPPDIPAAHTADTYNADYDRLPDDIPRAAKSLQWAVLHLREYDTDGNKRIRVQALLPNERTAVIDTWPGDGGLIHVAIRVGVAGDAAREKQFLDTLRRTLAMKSVE